MYPMGYAYAGGNMFGNNIMNPQQQMKWMERPPGDTDPLAHLKVLNSLQIKQVVTMTELMTGLASQAKYGIFNDKGEQVYYAYEESDPYQRYNCPTTRQFVLHIINNANQELIRISRDFRCCAGHNLCACCDSCSQEIAVEYPPGTLLGSVSQECSCFSPHYTLKDATNNPLMSIVGPGCICDGAQACCCENKFTIYGTDGTTEIGAIFKKYRGYFAEAMTSADMFAMQVPLNLDVRMKVISLAALFLIDFAHFSEPPAR